MKAVASMAMAACVACLQGCGGGGAGDTPAEDTPLLQQGGGAVRAAPDVSESALLGWALDVALQVKPEDNQYANSPMWVTWPGVAGSDRYGNHSNCSGFVSLVMRQAYLLPEADMRAWLGSALPTSARWHDAIAAGQGFVRRGTVDAIEPGDVVAIKYLDGTSDVSGHTMIARARPVLRPGSEPLLAGTRQYALAVVDSTSSPHGTGDSRTAPGRPAGTGAGVGTLRLYADDGGRIVGYTWSLSKSSVFYAPTERSLVAGKAAPPVPTRR